METKTKQTGHKTPETHICISSDRLDKIEQRQNKFYKDQEDRDEQAVKRDKQIYKAFKEIKTGLQEKGILNGVRDDKIEKIDTERKDGDKSLEDKIDDLSDLLIKFILAVMTILGIFISAVLTILFLHIFGKF